MMFIDVFYLDFKQDTINSKYLNEKMNLISHEMKCELNQILKFNSFPSMDYFLMVCVFYITCLIEYDYNNFKKLNTEIFNNNENKNHEHFYCNGLIISLRNNKNVNIIEYLISKTDIGKNMYEEGTTCLQLSMKNTSCEVFQLILNKYYFKKQICKKHFWKRVLTIKI